MFGLSFVAQAAYSQLLCHLVGDYLLQSSWMATEKRHAWLAACVHGICYSIPFFLFLNASIPALLVIGGTHIVIDHYRLARYVVWLRNNIAPKSKRTPPWSECKENGFPPGTPAHITDVLLIVVDNAMHVLINAWALWAF